MVEPNVAVGSAADLAKVSGKEGHAPSGAGAALKRIGLQGSVEAGGVKLSAAVEVLAKVVVARQQPSGWGPVDLATQVAINRVLAEIGDPKKLLPGPDGKLRTEQVPLIKDLQAAVACHHYDAHVNSKVTDHRYLEMLVLLTRGDDLPKVTTLAELLLKERVALAHRQSSFGDVTYHPPHDELLAGYLMSVRESLFLPALVDVARRNQLQGAYADALSAAVQAEHHLQGELMGTVATGLDAAPILARSYLQRLANEGAAFLQRIRESASPQSPRELFVRKLIDPAFEIDAEAVFRAAERSNSVGSLDQYFTATRVPIDADVLRRATDALVEPRLFWDPSATEHSKTLGRLLSLAKVAANGPTPLEIVTEHLRKEYGPRPAGPMSEEGALRRMAALYTLGQLGTLNAADADGLVNEIISQRSVKVGPNETTLAAFITEMLRRGSNIQGRDQQPLVVLRRQLREHLFGGSAEPAQLGRYLVERHWVKPGTLSDSQLTFLVEELLYQYLRAGSGLNELKAAIGSAAAERAAHEATLGFRLRNFLAKLGA